MAIGKPTISRFSIEIPVRDASNGIYCAMCNEVARLGGTFVMDDKIRHCIGLAAQWLVGSPQKPGLLLMGKCGNGKTTLANAVAALVEFLTEMENGRSRRKVFRFETAKSICRLCATDSKAYESLFSEKMLVIDDLGEEPTEILLFGMVHTPVIDLLGERYAQRQLTIASTNLRKQQLIEKYGERIYDRFREMMAIIPFTGESYRGGRTTQTKTTQTIWQE